jgi:hypothetical protein
MKTGRESRPKTVRCKCQERISRGLAKSRYPDKIVPAAPLPLKNAKTTAEYERLLGIKIGHSRLIELNE